MMNRDQEQSDVDMDPNDLKVEQEIDELEEDDFASASSDEIEGGIYDVALPEPRVQTVTTKQLHRMIHEGEVDISPPYQRGDVWTDSKRTGLIDSIFRNFFIPPVIFAVTMEDDEEVRTCVDGKQRLTSIQKFYDGQVPHKDSRNGKKYWYTAPANSGKVELPQFFKEEFQKKEITVVEFHGIAAGTERELFQRVQLGMPLTAAGELYRFFTLCFKNLSLHLPYLEKVQAVASPWAEWIGQLIARHISIEDGLGHKLDWDINRGRDFQNVAHMIFCCDGIKEQPLPTAQKIERWIHREDHPTRQFQDDIDKVLRCLWVIANEKEYSDAFKKIQQRIAPVEFIFIGVLLYVLKREDYETQSKAIYTLRKTIRSEFKDIRNNGDVGKAMWRHINELRERPHATQLSNYTIVSPIKTTKRKRNSGANEDDDEFRPKPIRSIGKAIKTRAKRT